MENVVALELEEDIAGMAALEVSLSAQGQADPSGTTDYLDRSVLDFGTRVTVALGPDDSSPLFEGSITALGRRLPGGLLLDGDDQGGGWAAGAPAYPAYPDVRGAAPPPTSPRPIAGDHGLTAQIDVDGPQRPLTSQVNLSDLAFLRTLAQADGAEIWLEGTTLRLQRRPDRDGDPVRLVYGEALRSFAVTADLAHQCTDLTVTGWSPADKEAIAETAGADDLGDELAGDTSGATLLAAAFDERHERVVVAEPLDSADARARARAAYLDRARRFVTGTGTCEGERGGPGRRPRHAGGGRHRLQRRLPGGAHLPPLGPRGAVTRRTSTSSEWGWGRRHERHAEHRPVGRGRHERQPTDDTADRRRGERDRRGQPGPAAARPGEGAACRRSVRTMSSGRGSRPPWRATGAAPGSCPTSTTRCWSPSATADPRIRTSSARLWNGHDAPPHQMDADNDVKTIVSRRGIRITLDDTPGATSLTLSTPAGQKVTLSDADPGITLTDASQNSVQLGPGGITISTLAAVSIKALSLDIDAATVSVTAPAVTFAGVVTGNALAAQVISGAMYSRGIGNLA